MKGLWQQEAYLFLKQRLALPALLLMAILSIASVWAGMAEIARQKDTIARIQPQQANDGAAIAKTRCAGIEDRPLMYRVIRRLENTMTSLPVASH